MQRPSDRESAYVNQPSDQDQRRGIQLPAIIAESPSEYHSSDRDFGLASGRPVAHFSHNAITGSPIEHSTMSGDFYRIPIGGPRTSQLGQFAPNLMQNPKRAYRQRRKDPSCDACRERKVKCDATETTSCHECSSRNVRCQFTKDTNRRMSSIKQVQDLERQLQEVRTQLERVRASENLIDHQSPSLSVHSDNDGLDVSRSPRRMLKARPTQDLAAARAQLADIGRGIMKPPVSPLSPDNQDRRPSPSASLPSREAAQHCLDAYLECVHRRLPIVHWATFCQGLWQLYSITDPPSATREFIALCFAVLAIGALFSHDSHIKEQSGELLTVAFSHMDFLVDGIGINQGLATFLICLYLSEMNAKSVSYIWLGSAIRVAQDKGLHVQAGHWSTLDGEMRKRIWYSLYLSDRLLSAEIGRPMIIHDDDCDTEYPGALQEEDQSDDPLDPYKPTVLLASVHVARLLAPLAKLCRSLCIPSEAIKRFEVHLSNCMHLFPRQLQLGNPSSLDPLTMAPIITFQNTRLLLYRHNLTPACSPEQRSAAIDKCMLTARDTAEVLERCWRAELPTDQLQARLRVSATFFTCTHVWRCMLFLAFRWQWEPFFVLLRFSSLIGDSRPVNISCGRHLSFFVKKIVEAVRNGERADLEDDEDLLVLLSGDLQAGTSGWIWGTAESGTFLSKRQKHSRIVTPVTDSPLSGGSHEGAYSWDTFLTPEEAQEWGGWQGIQEAATWLRDTQQKTPNTAKMPHRPHHTSPGDRPMSEADAKDARSRMAIASITDS